MWIRNRVMAFLGISGHELQFYKLLNANNRYYEDKLLNFLILDVYGVTDLERKVIFFYCTYLTETIQEEVPIWESRHNVSKLAALTALAMKRKNRRLARSAFGKKEESETKVVAKRKKKGKKSKAKTSKVDPLALLRQMEESTMTLTSEQKSTKSASATSDEEAEYGDDEDEEEEERREDQREEGDEEVESKETGSGDTLLKKKDEEKSVDIETLSIPPPPEEEHKYIMTKKIVEKVIKIPVLHMLCGKVDGGRADLQDVTLFYFLRTSDEGVPNFDSYQECENEITNYLVVGSLQGKFLVSMNKILVQSSIFRRPSEFRRMSIVIAKKQAQADIAEGDEDNASKSSLPVSSITNKRDRVRAKRKPPKSSAVSFDEKTKEESRQSVDHNKNDIMSYLDKLIKNVEWTLENIEGDILLTMPNIPELDDPNVTDEMLEKNKEVIEHLENLIMSWGVHIQKVLESFQTKVPQGKGPLAEHSYWEERETGLLMLVEQLKIPVAKRILNLLNNVLSPVPSNFEYFYSDLWKFYTEARDNSRFLQTVLRHFKVYKIYRNFLKKNWDFVTTNGLTSLSKLSNFQ
ncbi:Dynein heavy chain 10, axonemal [Habropoda laboriosa]|uniref:Dynein heavy chain 10, axonemal n=1 Tax=Habropoda laboriosa TaxID=597456 RepID=A0A0L7QMT3_9HYME|nr:Dynein heavy chain 10, axonemal [Habropoda laboriosa]